jgi:hypothetical protein
VDLTWKDLIAFFFSGAALALGIVNWVKSNFIDVRTRLRIMPKCSFQIDNGYYSTQLSLRYEKRIRDLIAGDAGNGARIAIEISNLSSFHVFLDEVGIVSRRRKELGRGVLSLNPIVIPEGKMPYRLESKASVTFYGAAGSLYDLQRGWDAVFAETSHGYKKVQRIRCIDLVLDAIAKKAMPSGVTEREDIT